MMRIVSSRNSVEDGDWTHKMMMVRMVVLGVDKNGGGKEGDDR